MKRCIICKKEKNISEFYAHPEMADGHLNKCKECCKAYARARDTKAYDVRRYRENPKRYLSHKYYMIKNRCTSNRRKSCSGREFLSKEDWDIFCKRTSEQFMDLYHKWQKSGYKRMLSPSIDRIDNKKGYILGNMQWLTLAENDKKYIDENKRYILVKKDGKIVGKFSSQKEVAEAIGSFQGNVGRALRQGGRLSGGKRLVKGCTVEYFSGDI